MKAFKLPFDPHETIGVRLGRDAHGALVFEFDIDHQIVLETETGATSSYKRIMVSHVYDWEDLVKSAPSDEAKKKLLLYL